MAPAADKLPTPIPFSYSDLVNIIQIKGLSWQYIDQGDSYFVFASDQGIIYSTTIYKSPLSVGGIDPNQEQTNQLDFETKYKTIANKPLAQKLAPFAAGTVQFSGDSSDVVDIPSGSSTFNMDYKIDPKVFPNGVYLTGGELLTLNSAMGDFVSAQVVDVDGVLGAGLGFVVNTYIRRFYVQVPLNTQATITMEIDTNYAALIPANLYLRLSYTSVGATTVSAAVNYMLHAPL